jgi:hypothetical protein
VRLSNRILVSILDGKPHRLGDFLGYVMRGVDPKSAVRNYIHTSRRHRNGLPPDESVPLSKQMAVGIRRGVNESLWQLQKAGVISIHRPDGSPLEEAIIQLTQDGAFKLRDPKGRGNFAGSVWKEVRRLYEKDQAVVSISLYDGSGTFSTGKEQLNGTT